MTAPHSRYVVCCARALTIIANSITKKIAALLMIASQLET